MRILIDANILIALISDKNIRLYSLKDSQVVSNTLARARALLDVLGQDNNLKIIIPAPVLAEYLVKVEKENYQKVLDFVSLNPKLQVVNFDKLAAIECADLAKLDSPFNVKDINETKAKLVVDRQIVAIAKAHSVDEVWTHDQGLAKRLLQVSIVVKSLEDIECAPIQTQLFGT